MKDTKTNQTKIFAKFKIVVIAWAVFVLGSLTIHAGALIKVLNKLEAVVSWL